MSKFNRLIWNRVASVTPGGKPFFFVAKVPEYGSENWGHYRVIWDRRVLAYRASKDHKYAHDSDNNLGFYSTVPAAKAACERAAMPA